jgi:LPXTG-site transpeptidase (sortase) family protein
MTQEKLKFIILRTLGNFFVLFAAFGIAMTFGPVIYLEALYYFNAARNIRYVTKSSQLEKKDGQPVFEIEPADLSPTPKFTLFGQLTGGNKTEILSPVSSRFGLIIPKIGANVEIFPNVDAANPQIYLPVLQKGVAHAAGTVFPGVSGNIYLFAHSTDAFWNVGRYNAVFYLLNKLEKGDEIDIFSNGVRHIYKVTEKKIVNPSEVEYLTKPLPYEQLTLQTCWPPGTTLKRLIVIAKPERDLP